MLVESETINVADYLISGDVFFIETATSVELWFCNAWQADDFEYKVHLWLLGRNPVKRRGEFL